jgi:hypothetical protein
VCARSEETAFTTRSELYLYRPLTAAALRLASLAQGVLHVLHGCCERTLRFAEGEAQTKSNGADDQDRTGDLVLTKDALCQLSYIGPLSRPRHLRPARTLQRGRLGPKPLPLSNSDRACLAKAHATASIRVSEGWSGRRGSNPRPTAWKAVTLPLSYSRLRGARFTSRRYTAGTPDYARRSDLAPRCPPTPNLTECRSRDIAARREAPLAATNSATNLLLPARQPSHACRRGKVGGEGRVRTSVATRAADLQSAAIDRSATSPKYITRAARSTPGLTPDTPLPGHDCVGSQHRFSLRPWAAALKPAHVIGIRACPMYP